MEGEEWNTGHRTHHKQMTQLLHQTLKIKNTDGMFNPVARRGPETLLDFS